MSRSSREYEEHREKQEQADALAQQQAWAAMADETGSQGKPGM